MSEMHRYSVTYIARGGEIAEHIVYARDKKSAREKAEALNLEDIKSVKRVGFSVSPFFVIVLVIAVIVLISVQRGG